MAAFVSRLIRRLAILGRVFTHGLLRELPTRQSVATAKKALFFFSLFFLYISQAQAQDPNLFYYISDGSNPDELYTIDRTDGTTTLIGNAGTGITTIEAIAYFPIPGQRTVYAANAGNFGTLSQTTGTFTLIGEIDGGGTADGSAGAQSLNDVDGLMLDAQSLIMWAVERKGASADLLFQIDIATGLFVSDAFGSGIDYLEIVGDGLM